jgi:hypothetical protein
VEKLGKEIGREAESETFAQYNGTRRFRKKGKNKATKIAQ